MPYSQYYAMWDGDKVVEVNSGEYEAHGRDIITTYTTQAELDAVPAVAAFKAAQKAANDLTLLRRFDTAREYQGKQENAMRWLENNRNIALIDPLYETGDYTPEDYPWLQVDIEVFEMTPRECVQSIIEAINRPDEQWQSARERAQMRKDMSDS